MESNTLTLKDQFESVLANYNISEDGQKLLLNLRMVLLNGPSASGRNTIIDQLIKTGEYHKIVSDTTRLPRYNDGIKEVSGQSYWFRSEEEVLDDLRKGEFLEAEIIHNQQVSGISLRELKTAYEDNKIAITDVEIGGFKNIIAYKPDTVGVIVLPPSFDAWMERLNSRGKMPETEVLNRLKTGQRIFKEALGMGSIKIVVNDVFTQAVAEIDSLAHGGEYLEKDSKYKLAETLLAQTTAFLNNHS